MTFASVHSVETDYAGAGEIERASRRMWLHGQGEAWAEMASRIREARDAVPWAGRVNGESMQVSQRAGRRRETV